MLFFFKLTKQFSWKESNMFLSSRFSWVGKANFIRKIAWNNQKMHCKSSCLAIWKKDPHILGLLVRGVLYVCSLLHTQNLSWPRAHLLPPVTQLPVPWICHCQLAGTSVAVAKQSKSHNGFGERYRPAWMASAEIIVICHKWQQRKEPRSASGGAFCFECNGSVTHGATFSSRAQGCANKTNGNFVTARKESSIWPFGALHLILVCSPASIFNEKMWINKTKRVPQVPYLQ